MAININITKNKPYTLKTKNKYCNDDIKLNVNVSVPLPQLYPPTFIGISVDGICEFSDDQKNGSFTQYLILYINNIPNANIQLNSNGIGTFDLSTLGLDNGMTVLISASAHGNNFTDSELSNKISYTQGGGSGFTQVYPTVDSTNHVTRLSNLDTTKVYTIYIGEEGGIVGDLTYNSYTHLWVVSTGSKLNITANGSTSISIVYVYGRPDGGSSLEDCSPGLVNSCVIVKGDSVAYNDYMSCLTSTDGMYYWTYDR